ncbi:hypothetical protein SDC9_11664 [bioreactor metagenome]|uniref:Uncharacterized protein n=1 Tax=bioreactor metagenome TaxID=1076179 RepID=A0A644TGC0_9ZZZZ
MKIDNTLPILFDGIGSESRATPRDVIIDFNSHESQNAFTVASGVSVITSYCKSELVINVTPRYGKLKKNIFFSLEYDNGIWYAENKYFDIYINAESENEAIRDFIEFIEYDCETYISASDNKLTTEAVKLKKKYLEYFNVPNIARCN